MQKLNADVQAAVQDELKAAGLMASSEKSEPRDLDFAGMYHFPVVEADHAMLVHINALALEYQDIQPCRLTAQIRLLIIVLFVHKAGLLAWWGNVGD